MALPDSKTSGASGLVFVTALARRSRKRGRPHYARSGTERREHINTFEEMMRPLNRLFRQESLSWHPYYFWDVLSDIRIPNPRIEKRFASMVMNMEKFLLRTGEIQPVLFLYRGTK